MHLFSTRNEAGRALVTLLGDMIDENCTLVAVPNGGVPVATPIARTIGVDLRLLPVERVRLSEGSTLTIGAVGVYGSCVIDEDVVAFYGVDTRSIRVGLLEARLRLNTRHAKFSSFLVTEREALNRTVIVIDDGLATGCTLLAVIADIARLSPRRIIVAVPLTSGYAVKFLSLSGAEIIAVHRVDDGQFEVSSYYKAFDHITDLEVLDCLSPS